MTGILLLGFLIGMQHAFEADHVAAVSSMVTSGSSVRRAVKHGLAWGLGHSLILGAVTGLMIGFGLSVGEGWSSIFEFGVGLMLVVLGARVLLRLWREGGAWRVHKHSDGKAHVHFVTAESERTAHGPAEHAHRHGLPLGTISIGMVHGLAGSGSILMMTAVGLDTPSDAILYVLLFGVGSMIGMGVLSAIIAVPLHWTSKSLKVGNLAIQGAIGLVAIVIGITIAAENASALM
ncbi:HoxN/HupN/NixA family nickel/cobalt transporter [Nisaea nitritireducens]|uniref:HoxN/HupN/NixA family nickel/cobalt transporter n=1 Tax=Nisaea nitritireducens TaxID=568392 RepID=UPI001865EBB6|nr:urease accessory protein [Nisaea nitritireducens]